MSPPGLAELCAAVGVAPDRRGEVHIRCPNCGKEPKPGQTHFHVTEKGGHCFVCGWSASHVGLLRRLGADVPISPLYKRDKREREKERETAPLRPWQREPEWWVDFFACAPDSVPLWRAYRPLTPATIARRRLGVGPLPSSSCAHRRLVVPLTDGGRVVGFAGRAISCRACPKWLVSAGSGWPLFGAEDLYPGCTALVVENLVDAILARQEWPEYVTVAKRTADLWRPEWTARMAAVRPSFILFWPDNDPAGLRGAARGANALLGVGLVARVRRWSEQAPPKADLGQFFSAIRERSCAP